MADKLVIDYRTGGDFRIAWWLEDDDDFGLYIGELIHDVGESDSNDIEKQECLLAETVAKQTKGVQYDDCSLCFYWETIGNARAALREINTALNAFRSNKPWPEWAIKAKAEGWKPPKNWKP